MPYLKKFGNPLTTNYLYWGMIYSSLLLNFRLALLYMFLHH